MARYVMVECVAQCPSCRRGLAQTTLVEVAEGQPFGCELKIEMTFWSLDKLR